jgi:hypothetical protein
MDVEVQRGGVMRSLLAWSRHVGLSCCREECLRNVRVQFADPTQSSSRAVSDGEFPPGLH